jgi:hypothetical protein
MNRRRLLLGIAAPAIVRYANIMPVRLFKPVRDPNIIVPWPRSALETGQMTDLLRNYWWNLGPVGIHADLVAG